MAKKARVDASNIVIYENKAWFFALNYPCLCCYDYKRQEVVKKKFIYDKKGYIECLYENIIRIDNYIVGIPFWASSVYIYDIQKGEEYYVDILGQDDIRINAFYTSIICKNTIYAFRRFANTGENGNYVLKIDPFQKKAEYITLCLDEVNCNDSETIKVFANENYYEDEFAILLSEQGNIIRVSLSDFKCDFFKYKNIEYPFYTICRFGDNKYFLVDKIGAGVIWDGQHSYIKVNSSQIIESARNISSIGNKYLGAFENSVCYENTIYLIPSLSKVICEYDIENNIMRKAWFSDEIIFDIANKIKSDNYYVGFLSNAFLVGNVLFLFCVSSGTFYEIDLANKVVKANIIEVDFSKEEITYIGEYRFKHSTGILKEDERLEYGLQTFINMI